MFECLKRGDEIRVHWIDARYLGGWSEEEAAVRWAATCTMHAVTRGMFLFQDEDSIALVSTNMDGMVADANKIPKVCVKRIIRLSEETEGQ
jgi:hypothetical protein